MSQLRDGLVGRPVWPRRPTRGERDFVPHLTLDQRIEPGRLRDALGALASYRAQLLLRARHRLGTGRRAPVVADGGRPARQAHGRRAGQPRSGALGPRAPRPRRGGVGRRAVGAVPERALRQGARARSALRDRRQAPAARRSGSPTGEVTRPGHEARPADRQPPVARTGRRLAAAPSRGGAGGRKRLRPRPARDACRRGAGAVLHRARLPGHSQAARAGTTGATSS